MNDFILREDARKVLSTADFAPLDGKTLLLCGVTGLLGVNFLYTLAELHEKGLRIKVYAITKRGLPPHIAHFERYDWVRVLKGDLTDYLFLSSLPNADYIIQAGGYGQPMKFLADPVSVIKINTFAVFTLLEKLNSEGSFLFTSAASVYTGNNPILPAN